jgi:tetratricopeptide (TPR) repeat protein
MKSTTKKVKETTVIPSETSWKKYAYMLGLFAFFLFANTLGNDYNMDDSMVTRNHPITSKGLSAIGEIFTSPYYSDAMGYAYGYRPMVHLSFALEHDLFGEKPGAGHFINVILFALSVMLFFKLLLQWVGTKNSLFALLTTLLFIVHPLHTEVVASLKNRDEILAFLFVVWTGLAMARYIDRNKISSLLGVFLLFSFAMLSKKSVYPMVFILPFAFLFTREIKLKQLLIFSIAMIIPGAIIGSELQVNRMILMTLAPITGILVVYFIKKEFIEKELRIQQLLSSWIAPAAGILVVLILSYFVSPWLLFFLLPLLYWLLKIDIEKGLITAFVSFIIIDFLILKSYPLRVLAMSIPIVYLSYQLINKEKITSIWYVLAALGISYFIFNNHGLLEALLIVNFIVLVLVSLKKPVIGVLLSLGVFIGWWIYNPSENPNFYTTFALIFPLMQWSEKWFKSSFSIRYFIIPAFALSSLFIAQNIFEMSKTAPTQVEKAENSKPTLNQPIASDSFLKEGRMLEYAENTLIAPHSKTELAATGLLTLGTYMKLFFYPKDLSFYYGFSTLKTVDFSNGLVWISLFFHLLLIILALWQIKKRPLITIGVVWYLLSILLFSNWVELVAGMVGERLAFTASAGLSIVIVSLILWYEPTISLKKLSIGSGVIVAILLLFGVRTFIRNKDWKDTFTLMSHDISHLESSAQANNVFARALMERSVLDKSLTQQQRLDMQRRAINHFDKATEIWPDFFNAHFDKGMAARHIPDNPKAIEAFTHVLEMNPKFWDAYSNLIEVYEQAGDQENQLKTAQAFLDKSQLNSAYVLVARAYFILNNKEQALKTIEAGLQQHPNDELLLNNLNALKGQ